MTWSDLVCRKITLAGSWRMDLGLFWGLKEVDSYSRASNWYVSAAAVTVICFQWPSRGDYEEAHAKQSSSVQGRWNSEVSHKWKEVLASSVKCCQTVEIIPEKYLLDLLSWGSLVNLAGAVSVECSTGDVNQVWLYRPGKSTVSRGCQTILI